VAVTLVGCGRQQALIRPTGVAESHAEMRTWPNIVYASFPDVDPNLTSLDVYAPANARQAPVVVMIHGGGWRRGDKALARMAGLKSEFFTGAGYVFVSVNYRLSPEVRHPTHVQDVARALAYVYDHIAEYGGDPEQIIVMGHSAGAHLAALVATDERYLAQAGKDLTLLKGVILLDGAGYDIPALMRTAGPLGRAIYEAAFTSDPAVQRDASPITHVAPGKGIAPFLLIHVATREASAAESRQLAAALQDAGAHAEVLAAEGKTHKTINTELGQPGDGPTQAVMAFLEARHDSR
jgi:acetyl esterase/lipase